MKKSTARVQVDLLSSTSVFRTGEDEVHVAAGCSYPEMEPRYHEAGALPGSYSGEQQRRRTKGEGVSVLFNFSVCHIISHPDQPTLITKMQ